MSPRSLSVRGFEIVTLWASIPLFLLLWQAASTSGYVNELLFPPPTKVAQALWDELIKGTLLLDLSMSVMRVVIGFASGAAAGIAVGLLTGRYQIASNLLTPIFQLLRPIPPIAFVPIVILWFGLSEWGKWFLVFWGVFFTVWVATHLGVQRADPALIRAARSLGAPDRMLIRDVILPSALPTIFVGLRTAVSISFYTLVAAELAGAVAGLAYRIDLAHQNMQTGQMLGGLVMLGIVSACADRGFAMLSRRLRVVELSPVSVVRPIRVCRGHQCPAEGRSWPHHGRQHRRRIRRWPRRGGSPSIRCVSMSGRANSSACSVRPAAASRRS